VCRPASDHDLNVLGKGPVLENFRRDWYTYLLDDSEDIAFCGISIRSNNEIGGGEGVEMSNMTVDKRRCII
jgi:hypothetical protein